MKKIKINAPVFEEAELVFECRKIYSDDLKAHKIPAEIKEKCYPSDNYHRLYIGEVLNIKAAE